MAKFCVKCGVPLDENGLCPSCGALAVPVKPQAEEVESYGQEEEQTRGFCPRCGGKVGSGGFCTSCGIKPEEYLQGGGGYRGGRGFFGEILDSFSIFFQRASIYDIIALAGLFFLFLGDILNNSYLCMRIFFIIGFLCFGAWVVAAILNRRANNVVRLICGLLGIFTTIKMFIPWGAVYVTMEYFILVSLLIDMLCAEKNRTMQWILMITAGLLSIFCFVWTPNAALYYISFAICDFITMVAFIYSSAARFPKRNAWYE